MCFVVEKRGLSTLCLQATKTLSCPKTLIRWFEIVSLFRSLPVVE